MPTDRPTADLVDRAGIARVGINDTVYMTLVHICPGRQTRETSLRIALPELAATPEQSIAERIIDWARNLRAQGHTAEDIKQ